MRCVFFRHLITSHGINTKSRAIQTLFCLSAKFELCVGNLTRFGLVRDLKVVMKRPLTIVLDLRLECLVKLEIMSFNVCDLRLKLLTMRFKIKLSATMPPRRAPSGRVRAAPTKISA